MLKLTAWILVAVLLPSQVYAAVVRFVTSPNGLAYEAKITQTDDASSVSIYQDDRLLGIYRNLIVDETSISSSLVSTASGGVALAIESNGSRNKYSILAPIELIGGKLYIQCLYKNVFDSVEETRSVGAICEKQDLKRFDVFASINMKGIFTFTANRNWLRDLPHQICPRPVGLQAGQYKIVRCSNEGQSVEARQRIIVFDHQNKLMFSIDGYEFFPTENGSIFFLEGLLKNKIIVFKGDLVCYERKSNSSNALHGFGEFVDGREIDYTLAIANANECLNGHYEYNGSTQEIPLKGGVTEGRYYLLQLDTDYVVTGIFILNQIEEMMRGIWVTAPPRDIFEVNLN
jgi:hypothetical protein